MAQHKPMRPVPRGGSAGFIPGRYKTSPEDFVVEEVPLFAPSGAGTHTIVVGLIYLALGLLARRGVKITAAIGAAVFVIEAVLNFGGAVGAGSFSSSWLLSRMLIAYWLIQAARNTLRPTADGSPGT